jgi:hypothetical protein
MHALIFMAVPVTRTPAARCRHAIGAEKLPGEFQHIKAAAALARSFFSWLGWFGFHSFRRSGFRQKAALFKFRKAALCRDAATKSVCVRD